MATVQTSPVDTMNTAGSTLSGILHFFMDNWIIILMAIILAIVIGLVFVLRKQQELERQERDSEAYAMYNTVMADCKLNADRKKIKKNYSWLNLFWLGIPFKWNEHSAKILDADRNLIGFYRGHFDSQDGCRNYLVYKTKSFIFFEDLFIIRYNRKISRAIGTEVKADKSKNIKAVEETYQELNFDDMVWVDRHNSDIHMQCTGVQKISIYYRTPNFVYDLKDRTVIDVRKQTHGAIMDDTWKLSYERMVNTSSKTVRKAVEGNPFVQAKKQGGEIEQENKEIETEERYTK